jgi:hypothetical protein
VSDDLPPSGNDDFVDHEHADIFNKFADPNPTHGENTEDEKLEVFDGDDDKPAP